MKRNDNKIEYELRSCKVHDKKALFHKWASIAITNGFSQLKGHSTMGLVEYEDGSVDAVYPGEIKFCDNKFRECWLEE